MIIGGKDATTATLPRTRRIVPCRIVAERELDHLFRDKRVTPENLAAATSKAAVAQGRVRESHVRYHLAMMEVLSPEQVSRYQRLRGY